MSFAHEERWKKEYELAVRKNSATCTIVPARKGNLAVWKGYLKTSKQLHSMEIRLQYRARDGRVLFYPLMPPEVEWQTPIQHPNIQPPRPKGEGIICFDPFLKPDHWNPKTHVVDILSFIELILNNPNPADPINHPTCLVVAIAMIREKLGKDSIQTNHPTTTRILAMLTDAEVIIQKYSTYWNKVIRGSEDERKRDQAWNLVCQAGKLLATMR